MNIKILIATTIVGFGIAGAYLLIQNALPPVALEDSKISEENQPTAQLPKIENLIGQTDQTHQIAGTADSEQNNLTELIIEKFSRTIAEQNPNGPETIEDQSWLNVPDTETLAADLIAEAFTNFDPNSLRPVIADADLQILEDKSPEAVTNYVLSFNKIVEEAAANIQVSSSKPIENLTLEDFRPLAKAYSQVFDNLKSLTIPRVFLEIHKQELVLYGVKKNIFQKVTDFREDPTAALIAVSELPLVDEELDKITEEFNELIKTLI